MQRVWNLYMMVLNRTTEENAKNARGLDETIGVYCAACTSKRMLSRHSMELGYALLS